jgi:glutamate racemase
VVVLLCTKYPLALLTNVFHQQAGHTTELATPKTTKDRENHTLRQQLNSFM